MEFYIDGQKVGNIEDIEIETETKTNKQFDLSFDKELTVTLKNVNIVGIGLMSDEMRKWCKLMRWNGKIYL